MAAPGEKSIWRLALAVPEAKEVNLEEMSVFYTIQAPREGFQDGEYLDQMIPCLQNKTKPYN